MLDPNQIRFARTQLSLSQRELSRRANISRTALNQFEQGKYVPGAHFSRKLRDFFETHGVSLTMKADKRIATTRTLPQEAINLSLSNTEPDGPIYTVEAEETDDTSAGAVMLLLAFGLSLILGRKIGS